MRETHRLVHGAVAHVTRPMGAKSREHLYGSIVRMAASQAAGARRNSDKLACDAWTKRMLIFAMLGDAINASFGFLEIRCGACDYSTLDLTIIRRPKETTPIHELERQLHCRDCSSPVGYRVKPRQLIARSSADANQRDNAASRLVAGRAVGQSAMTPAT